MIYTPSRSPKEQVDERLITEAYAQISSGTFPDMHEVDPEFHLWLGNQRAAGRFFSWEDPNGSLRAEALSKLKTGRIARIVCCCGTEESWQIFRNDGIKVRSY